MEMLSDDEWVRLKAALDAAWSGTGRPLMGERRVVAAVVWRQRDGAKRRSLPAEFGPWWKAARPHIRWSRAGVWERAFDHLRAAGRPDLGPELGELLMDGTSVRAHHKAAGAKGGPEPRAWPLEGRLRTKACAICDGQCRAIGFAVIPGQASELRAASALLVLATRLGRIGRVVCGRGCSSGPWRSAIRAAGATPCVPGQPTRARAPPHDRPACARRHRIENLWARVKEWRAIATRYDKTAASFMGGLHLAASLD